MIQILKTVKKINYIYFFHKKFLKLFVKSIPLGYHLTFLANNMIHLHLITHKDRNKTWVRPMRIREMFVAFIRDTNSVAHAYHEIGPINCK